MTATDAIILGIVQGLAEFLPVSSSGHLVVSQKLLGIEVHDLAFDIAAHVGTLLAILTVYFGLVRKIFAAALRKDFWFGESPEGRLMWLVVAGSIPTAAIGLTFKETFEGLFNNYFSLGICFILSGLMLLLTRLKSAGHVSAQALDSLEGIENVKWWQAAIIGFAQALAIAPAVSRSGTTIVTGLMLGISGGTAAMFSFMLSVPAVAGAAILELKDIDWGSSSSSHLLIGALAAYIAGVVGLKSIIATVRRGRLDIFSAYMIAVGVWVLWAWA